MGFVNENRCSGVNFGTPMPALTSPIRGSVIASGEELISVSGDGAFQMVLGFDSGADGDPVIEVWDTRRRTMLLSEQAMDGAVSADGSQAVFIDQLHRVFVADLQSGTLEELETGSPDEVEVAMCISPTSIYALGLKIEGNGEYYIGPEEWTAKVPSSVVLTAWDIESGQRFQVGSLLSSSNKFRVSFDLGSVMVADSAGVEQTSCKYCEDLSLDRIVSEVERIAPG